MLLVFAADRKALCAKSFWGIEAQGNEGNSKGIPG